MRRPSRTTVVDALTLFACIALAVGFAGGMIYNCQPGAGGHLACVWAFNQHSSTDDWRYFVMVWEAARVALADFHQWPSWNPYHCGGIVLYQDPQAPFPGPLFFLLAFVLPAVAAMKVWFISHLVAGALGARKLVKDAGGNPPEQILAAAVVTAPGFLPEHMGGGHFSFLPLLFIPWVLWAHRRALQDARWGILVAALLAVSFFEGATYPIPLTLVVLGIDTFLRLGNPADRRALAVSLPVTFGLFPLLAGARLLPVLRYLAEHPRLVPLDDGMSIAEVFEAWTTREHERGFPGHPYVWGEYADYIGVIPVAVAMLALLVAALRRDERTRDRRIDAFLFVGLVWFALGNIPGFSVWAVLHLLPVYKSLRVPSRFLYPANVGIAALCAWALSAVRTTMTEQRVRVGIARAFVAMELVVALFVAGDLIATNGKRMQQGLDPVEPRALASSHFYQQNGGDYWRLTTYPVRGIGTRQCYVPLEWGPAPGLWDGDVPQFRLTPATAGTLQQTRWTPNAVRFHAALTHPARLVVNQNYDIGWTTSAGTIVSLNGVLAVDLPAGTYDVTVQHRPGGIVPGAVLTLTGILLAILAALRLTPEAVEKLRARARRLVTAPEG